MLQKLTFVAGSSLLNSKRLLVAQLKVGGHSKKQRKEITKYDFPAQYISMQKNDWRQCDHERTE
jgi:hypothetical protein